VPPDINATVERVQTLRHQRRFADALRELDVFMARHSLDRNIDLLRLRVQILADANMDAEGVDTLLRIRAIDSSVGRNPHFLEALAIGQAASRQFDAALRTIGELEAVAGYNIPLYLQMKAETLIMAGRVNEGDQVVQQLARVDPNNPLVQQRSRYLKVGNNYVGKKDAVAGGCALCAVLELIFDCL
jgi:predicted Zn-dependent protease